MHRDTRRLRNAAPRLLAFALALVSVPALAAPAISIVIDDLGDKLTAGRAAIALPGAVACAFLPESPHTQRLAAEAHAAGKAVMLHLPLQPLNGKAHPLALNASQSAASRAAHLQRLLKAVPHARGVNNHQGSRATESREQMHWLMRELSLAGIDYFVDSGTSAHSQAYALARAYGMPTLKRRVFLDNEPTAAAVNAEFDRLLRLARRDGLALAIGHPHEATLQVLRERLPQLAQEGIELISPVQMLARTRPAPVVYPARLRYSNTLAPIVAKAAAAATTSAAGIPPGAPAQDQRGATQ